MKIDWYTKFVLTVIAVALVWLSLRDDVSPRVLAQGNQKPIIQKVELVTADGSPAYIKDVGFPVLVGRWGSTLPPLGVFVENGSFSGSSPLRVVISNK
jgi:hypothetical protein